MADQLESFGPDLKDLSLESSLKDEFSMDSNPPPLSESVASVEDWRKALGKVVPAVVVLRATATRAFDTELAGAGSATGFVVDKRRGIILTNRHVVKPGPIVAEAMFVNREEVPVHPVYRDPVHDFGFFRYDPSAIQFLNYEEIPLSPEAACVGLEIRVVGNDSGEKVSILAGTIARLDRDAPNYKSNGYNDFNTFYMQAASGTKRGSSGSPVVDWQGRAVALNAGGHTTSSASAFFLPLERVVRALKFLQQGRDCYVSKWEKVSIPRGTLQATFLHKGFDETRRLGLLSETEEIVRRASPQEETGMLVVDSAVPGGPAHKLLEPGDLLVHVNGEVITHFMKLATLLDDSVNQKIELQLERGGTSYTVHLVVQDLHSVTPDFFLEVGGAVIHPLSYQQARNFQFHCGLVYVAESGYMFSRVPRHSIIKKFACEEISKLEDFVLALSKLSRGARVPVEYISHFDRYRRKSLLVTIDRHEWYACPQIYTRDDDTGLWNAKPAFNPYHHLLSSPISDVGDSLVTQTIQPNDDSSCLKNPYKNSNLESSDGVVCMESNSEQLSEEPRFQDVSKVGTKERRTEDDLPIDRQVADCSLHDTQEIKLEDPNTMHDVDLRDHQGGEATAAGASANASFAERVIEPTLVMLDVHVPLSCMLDGVRSQNSFGTGVIIYHSQSMGLIVIDKNTVSVSSSDVMLSFAAFPIEIPGELVFLHPVHNFALVAYDPSALGVIGAAVVRAAELLPEPALRRGDSVYLIGLSRSLQATSRKSNVTNPCAALIIGSADSPRYRATNMEVIELDTDFGSKFSGVLTDENGRVQAIWGSFSSQKSSGSSSEDRQFVKGIPVYTISQVLNKIISGANGPDLLINGVKRPMPFVRMLEVELQPRLLSKARSFGLTDHWVQALVKKDPIRRQVLKVKGCLAGSKAEKQLEEGDMVLAINKQPVTCFSDIGNACEELDQRADNDGNLNMTIFRQGREIELLVGTDVRDGIGTTHMINWSGCVVQDPHPAVRALGFLPEEGHGVYVTRQCHGSPVHKYGLYANQWIVEVNGKLTPSLEAFVNVTKELGHGEFVRVKMVRLNGKPRVLTLKQDLHYWPTWELRFNPNTAMWHRRTIKALQGSSL